MATHYETLGVDPGASKEEILKAYRRKALEFHPDVNKNAPPGIMVQLNIAKDILMDDLKRAAYDIEIFANSSSYRKSSWDDRRRDEERSRERASSGSNGNGASSGEASEGSRRHEGERSREQASSRSNGSGSSRSDTGHRYERGRSRGRTSSRPNGKNSRRRRQSTPSSPEDSVTAKGWYPARWYLTLARWYHTSSMQSLAKVWNGRMQRYDYYYFDEQDEDFEFVRLSGLTIAITVGGSAVGYTLFRMLL